MRIRPWVLFVPILFGCTPGKAGNGLQCVGSESIDPMENQAKYDPYEQNAFFSDRRAMRTPPKGAISREAPEERGPTATGTNDAGFLSSIPFAVTREFLMVGRERFDIFCAACHGLVGDGESVVAARMALRPPPSLVGGRVASFSPGRIFHVATEGYGMMPSYRAVLNQRERWAVAAYVRALVESQNAPLASAPVAVRAKLEDGAL